MFFYWKCGKWFAVYGELNREFGPWPFFSLNSCNEETIMDIPYARIILTPGRCLARETMIDDDHDNSLAQNDNDDVQEQELPEPFARVAKD